MAELHTPLEIRLMQDVVRNEIANIYLHAVFLGKGSQNVGLIIDDDRNSGFSKVMPS